MSHLLPVAPTKITWRMLMRNALKTPGQFVALLVLFVLSSLTALATPVIIGRLIDAASLGYLTGFPWGFIAAIALAVVAGALLTRAWSFQGQKIGIRLNRDLGIDMVGSALTLDAQTVEDAGAGDLLSRLTDDVDSIRQTLAQGLPEFMYITVYMLLTAATIFAVNPYIGLVTVPMFVLMAIMLSIFLPKIGRLTLNRTEAMSAFTVVANENMRGASTIRELGVVQARQEVQSARTEDVFRISRQMVGLRATYWAIDGFNAYMPLLLSVGWGAYCVERGWASWGDAATASIMLFGMRVNADIFTYWLDKLREMSVTMGRVFGVIDLAQQQKSRRSLVHQESVADTVASARGENSIVSCQSVVYGYNPEKPVIRGINLEIQPGESLALVGRSGSGKTTLARLIAGSLTADSGTISVAGHLVGNGLYPTDHGADARPRLLICTQEAHLFAGTLADNMTVAAPDVTAEEQIAALHAVGAHWVDEVPQGLATEVGANGFELTRDQVQQLALARIVAANPHLVILDESTTQLDLADARESLAAVMQGRAVIIISHDARIASLADRAVLLENGELIAEGSPAEIFARA
ncbi:ABC transporter ATP-binding protein [Rothia sp. ZJ1223]|uniref:ABC transporter ATP-binding protein n=1 Tax=Rothia sp. ZJ1223 TaxID=2811098 RepID=UPI00195E23D6|nr:ABC transporter ATP-binding protein [Rothia sp. ZJ1223]MBM7050621.1 ABC transporter ATP-binding protein [Rothia sp. ZJ1223]